MNNRSGRSTLLEQEWAEEGLVRFKGKEYRLKHLSEQALRSLQERIRTDRHYSHELLNREDIKRDLAQEEEYENWRNKTRILLTVRKNQLNAVQFEFERRKRRSRRIQDFFIKAIDELYGSETRQAVYLRALELFNEALLEDTRKEEAGLRLRTSPQDIKKSMCDGKVAHDKKRWANEHIEQMKARGLDTVGLCAYQCIYCDKWHVGHEPRGKMWDEE